MYFLKTVVCVSAASKTLHFRCCVEPNPDTAFPTLPQSLDQLYIMDVGNIQTCHCMYYTKVVLIKFDLTKP